MLRSIGLSLILLVSTVVMLPLATSTAHGLRSPYGTFSQRRYHHHSRAWWRRHRARLRRRHALLARRRALRALRLAAAPAASAKVSDNHVALPAALAFPETVYHAGILTLPLPKGWSAASTGNGSSTFRITAPDGASAGAAALSVVALAPANPNQGLGQEQKRVLGGLSFSNLRRMVIDKMLNLGGWVVNDRDRKIGDYRVFQVIAQTPASSDSASQTWDFYFTEIDGRVYALTTRAAGDFNEQLTTDAENFISSFRPMTKQAAVAK